MLDSWHHGWSVDHQTLLANAILCLQVGRSCVNSVRILTWLIWVPTLQWFLFLLFKAFLSICMVRAQNLFWLMHSSLSLLTGPGTDPMFDQFESYPQKLEIVERKRSNCSFFKQEALSCTIYEVAVSSHYLHFHLDQRSRGSQSTTREKNEAVRQRGAEKEGPRGVRFGFQV